MRATYNKKRMISGAFSALVALGCGDSNSPVEPNVAPNPAPSAEARQQIVFYGTTVSAGSLVLINSDGSGVVSLTSEGRSPAWSPDGSKLLFSTTECDTDWTNYYRCDKGGLRLMNFETKQLTTPVKGAFGEDPTWAPSGDLIAFVRLDEGTGRGRRLFVMPLDGSEPREIPTPVTEAAAPSWSPDGKRIAFQCFVSPESICVINVDGTGFARLISSVSGASNASPVWSPDGSQIAFAASTGAIARIALMSPDGSGGIVLGEGREPAWAPDGTKLAFSRNDGLFTMNRGGSNVKRLT